MNSVALTLRNDVIRFSKEVAVRGLVPNTQGNVSVRDPQTGLIAITPHDLPYDSMTPDDLSIVDVNGQQVAGPHGPSYETPVHCVVYRQRPDVFAIIHSEPIYVNTLGALGKPIEPVVASLLTNLGGRVPVMPFLLSGSEHFGNAMMKVLQQGAGVIWANHGLLTVGRTVEEAFRRTVICEHAAQIYYNALLYGEPTLVASDQIEKIVG